MPLRVQYPGLLNRVGKGGGMVDPIADMLTRIRNAIMARHDSVDIPYSNIKFGISKIMKEEGYIRNYKTFVDETRKKFLKVYISYDENSKSVITGLQRVSKPGRRVYVGADAISKLKHRLSVVVVSTSKGLMSDRNAFKNKVGGEPLLMVW
jgi:small subunit ribosomal protein S8